MKTLLLSVAIALITITIFSCGKTTVTPVVHGKVDTSTTLISNTELVGKWSLTKDTVNVAGTGDVYHGVAGDTYTFTKYSNLYVHLTPNNIIDTATYSISSINNQVSWINLYYSINGISVTGTSYSYPFTITLVDDHHLTITSNQSTASGQRYEQMTFTK